MTTSSHRKCQRSGRVVIVSMLVGVVLLQLCLSILIELRWVGVRDPEYALHEMRWRDRLAEGPRRTRVVFLGSSRVACGIDAGQITTVLGPDTVAFNFGVARGGLIAQRAYLERLHASNLLPDVVYIEILVPYLGGKDIPFEQLGLDANRFSLGEMADVPLSLKYLRGGFRRWLYHRSFPSQAYATPLRQQWKMDNFLKTPDRDLESRGWDEYGWRASGPEDERRTALQGLAHRQYDEAYRSFTLNAEQVRRLDELLARCSELGIQPALLLMPEGSEFRNLFSATAEASLQNLLDNMKNKHRVRVIDARSWMDDDSFFDMHHLHGRAAVAFSERLLRQGIAHEVTRRTFAQSQ